MFYITKSYTVMAADCYNVQRSKYVPQEDAYNFVPLEKLYNFNQCAEEFNFFPIQAIGCSDSELKEDHRNDYNITIQDDVASKRNCKQNINISNSHVLSEYKLNNCDISKRKTVNTKMTDCADLPNPNYDSINLTNDIASNSTSIRLYQKLYRTVAKPNESVSTVSGYYVSLKHLFNVKSVMKLSVTSATVN